MSVNTYRLELLVTEQAAEMYPSVGTIEMCSDENAGYDLRIVVDAPPSTVPTLIPLGVKARMIRIATREECHFTLEPRSSIYKTGFMMANGRGIIDKSYRGQLMAPLVCISGTECPEPVRKGTRLFQILAPALGHISEVAYVSVMPETKRGEGGFGSTGS